MAHPLRLYAHRGASAELPENTLPAFQRALDIGVDALETDAHMTRDGHIVLSHDRTGLRCCGVAAEIRRSTLAEVESWDAGAGFRSPDGEAIHAGAGYRIPTLEAALVEFPATPFNVDIKQTEPAMVDPIIALIRRLRAEERVTLAAFHLRTLLRARVAGYRGPTSLPRAEVLTFVFAPPRLFRFLPFRGVAAQVPLAGGGMRFDTPEMVARCRAAGVRLDYWTVNDPVTAERLLEMGADGIMTDDPRGIEPVFEKFRTGNR